MGGVNKVILVGNLGQDPDVRELESGAVVASASLATNTVYTPKNGPNAGKQVKETEWWDLVAYGRNAEILRDFCPKGKQLFIEGRRRRREYDSDTYVHKETGKPARFRVDEVFVLQIQMLGSADNGGQRTQDHPDYRHPAEDVAVDAGDIPF